MPSWIWIRIPSADPDSADQNQCGSGSKILARKVKILTGSADRESGGYKEMSSI